MTDSWIHVAQEKQACCQPMYVNRLQVNIQGMEIGNWSEGSVIHSGEGIWTQSNGFRLMVAM